jgi:predicted metalloprotease
MCSRPFETRSLPSSLAATHRGFAFFVAFPKSSIRHLGFAHLCRPRGSIHSLLSSHDLGFYRLLQQRLGAGGDFAQACVTAHEVGHHVQNLLGITDRVQPMCGRVSESEYNQLSVRLELQANFLAGVWARYADRVKGVVEAGDIEEAMSAASAVGEDRLQRGARGYVVPDSFTHGSSEQRVRWFRRGYETGDLRQGDTFNTRDL